MKENSIEEDIKMIEILKNKNLYINIKPKSSICIDCINKNKNKHIEAEVVINEKLEEAINYTLSDYKRVLKENEELLEVKVSTSAHNRILELEKENEELTISNKEIDKECSRLEEKEVKLINENEHYKDLIYALKTYYDITEEDLEKCIKNDR